MLVRIASVAHTAFILFFFHFIFIYKTHYLREQIQFHLSPIFFSPHRSHFPGEFDFICNWLGNLAWTTDFAWHGHDAFDAAVNSTWVVDGAVAGSYKRADSLTFVKVKDAGHMVPRDQPKNALAMFKSFVYNTPL